MVSDVYVAPVADVSFGDIFSIGFLFDVHLRADAVQLGAQEIPAKRGGGTAYSDRFTGERAYVLGHGTPHRAILITDSCIIDTALGQGRDETRPKGRLLFAPITPARPDALATETFGRFPLPAHGEVSAGIAELRKCFMVDARDVAAHKDAREASLTDDFAEELEVRWNAFATRRGPLVALRNAEKLVDLLTRRRGLREPGADEKQVGQEVAEVIAQSWAVEGGHVEAFAELADDAEGENALLALAEGLRRLSEQATKAADLVARARLSNRPSP